MVAAKGDDAVAGQPRKHEKGAEGTRRFEFSYAAFFLPVPGMRPLNRGVQRRQKLLSARHPPAVRVLEFGESDLVTRHDSYSHAQPPRARQGTNQTSERISDSLGDKVRCSHSEHVSEVEDPIKLERVAAGLDLVEE